MVDPVGLGAAVVQFVDVGWRVSIGISRLCSDLKGAPQKVKSASRKLKHLLNLMRLIESEISTSQTSTLDVNIPQAQLDIRKELVEDCVRRAKELEDVLKKLTSEPGDNLLKKTWRAVISAKNESTILEKCSDLEDLKSSLSLWYESRSLNLVEKQL